MSINNNIHSRLGEVIVRLYRKSNKDLYIHISRTNDLESNEKSAAHVLKTI